MERRQDGCGGATLHRRVLPFDPVAEAAPACRVQLRRLLAGTPLEQRLDDGELALTELVTNAVLHGRAPLTVVLDLTGSRLRVEVRDGSPVSPTFSLLDPTAVTGRGLMLLSAVTDAWGLDPLPDGKSIWFELRQDGSRGADVDALLASWGDDLVADPARERVRVVLTGLDAPLLARSEAHVEALLRELALVVGAGTASPDQLRTAGAVLRAAAGIDAVRADLRRQLAAAMSARQELVDVSLTIRREDAEGVRDFTHALDEADRLSQAGTLLMAPTPAELSEVRRGYLQRILAQLAGQSGG